ncbi:hypothetical protein N7478_001387 [Penicillium angulare]|uniref:uncharacterized protein n=1 Tax=Penicillium angulare TaxID=116970 RepID=UPI00254105C6|nr:uncharacterized protein N7478_001387 [Penicillium angulare]KAJ5292136.1 hypothetical protein N7478_001387 [Penicillium angulare]
MPFNKKEGGSKMVGKSSHIPEAAVSLQQRVTQDKSPHQELLVALSRTGHDFVEEASIVNVTGSTRPLAFSLYVSSKVNGEIYGNLESIETAEASETASDPLSFHILIYPLADRKFAEGLKTLAKENAKR